MNKLIEISQDLRVLFCINDEYDDSELCHYVRTLSSHIERATPELFLRRVETLLYDIVIIDHRVEASDALFQSIRTIQSCCHSVMLLAENERTDRARFMKFYDANVDKVIYYPIDEAHLEQQLERLVLPYYELIQNRKYEHHLESIIFGKTKELENQHTIDTLTGLKNVTGLKELFEESLEKGLLFLDIDKFDTINTLYGMRRGDAVLQFVAKRLGKFLPLNTELFRITADEFVVIIHEPRKKQTEDLAHTIVSLFAEAPISLESLVLDISFSIGFAQGHDYDIFYNAKIANREAKFQGGHTAVGYSKESKFLKIQQENHFWINEIKSALKEERIEVYFQPMYDYHEQKVTKYEALARLRTKVGDIITPNFFLKPAILSEMMTTLSRVVIDKAFKTFANNTFDFSFNLTDQDFAEAYLLDFLRYKCEYYDIEPHRVYIEILEDNTLYGTDTLLDQIKALKREGFNISIDDFGVERSNFSRVLELEAEVIKIDGSFIKTLKEDPSSRIIIESIVDFAKKIGAKTIAEFVENRETFDLLHDMGVDYSQGYLIGKPLPDLETYAF